VLLILVENSLQQPLRVLRIETLKKCCHHDVCIDHAIEHMFYEVYQQLLIIMGMLVVNRLRNVLIFDYYTEVFSVLASSATFLSLYSLSFMCSVVPILKVVYLRCGGRTMKYKSGTIFIDDGG